MVKIETPIRNPGETLHRRYAKDGRSDIPNLALVTVQHTGTTSLRALLAGAGYITCKKMIVPETYKTGLLVYGHVLMHGEMLDAMNRFPVVTTTRNRESLEASWHRRGSSIAQLKKQLAWWAEHVEPVADVIIDIDDIDLEPLEKLIGKTLGTMPKLNSFEASL